MNAGQLLHTFSSDISAGVPSQQNASRMELAAIASKQAAAASQAGAPRVLQEKISSDEHRNAEEESDVYNI